MVESRSGPHGRVVASLAIGRESVGDVVGIGGGVEFGHVALVAARRDSGVTEHRSGPRRRVVASFAISRKSIGDVVGISGGVVFRQVTLTATGCNSGVIEPRAVPRHSVVAGFTIHREVAGDVVGGCRRLKIGLMARRARVRKSREAPILVARRAGNGDVGAGQRKTRMIKPGTRPSRRLVAPITIIDPALPRMIGGLGTHQVLLMAGFATRRRATQVAGLGTGVAAEACHGGVRTDQGKSGSVVHRDLTFGNPIGFVVALSALRPELASMLIFVTTHATAFCKDLDGATIVMAAQALGGPVSTDECDTGFLAVIELEIVANRMPTSFLVAKRAITWKRIMRHDRTASLVPMVSPNDFLLTGHHATGAKVA